MSFRCGHALDELNGDVAHQEAALIRAAFPCPDCLVAFARRQQCTTRIHVNLQKIAPGMAAFVAEVADACDEFGSLLATLGFARRARSRDELTPGGEVADASRGVWRKEFWFAVSTEPHLVVMLDAHVKSEMHWLSCYCPDGIKAVDYFSFPEQ
ncbi:hypothetical protein ACTSKR_14435 [Chitinibacteraceae bacterium HSL-7]